METNCGSCSDEEPLPPGSPSRKSKKSKKGKNKVKVTMENFTNKNIGHASKSVPLMPPRFSLPSNFNESLHGEFMARANFRPPKNMSEFSPRNVRPPMDFYRPVGPGQYPVQMPSVPGQMIGPGLGQISRDASLMGPGQVPPGSGPRQMTPGPRQMQMNPRQLQMGPGQMPMGLRPMQMGPGQMPLGPGHIQPGLGQMPTGPGQMPYHPMYGPFQNFPNYNQQMPYDPGNMPFPNSSPNQWLAQRFSCLNSESVNVSRPEFNTSEAEQSFNISRMPMPPKSESLSGLQGIPLPTMVPPVAKSKKKKPKKLKDDDVSETIVYTVQNNPSLNVERQYSSEEVSKNLERVLEMLSSRKNEGVKNKLELKVEKKLLEYDPLEADNDTDDSSNLEVNKEASTEKEVSATTDSNIATITDNIVDKMESCDSKKISKINDQNLGMSNLSADFKDKRNLESQHTKDNSKLSGTVSAYSKKFKLPTLGKEAAKKRLKAFSAFSASHSVKEKSKTVNTPTTVVLNENEPVKDSDEVVMKKKRKEKLSHIEQIKVDETKLKEVLNLTATSHLGHGVELYRFNKLLDDPKALENFEKRRQKLKEQLQQQESVEEINEKQIIKDLEKGIMKGKQSRWADVNESEISVNSGSELKPSTESTLESKLEDESTLESKLEDESTLESKLEENHIEVEPEVVQGQEQVKCEKENMRQSIEEKVKQLTKNKWEDAEEKVPEKVKFKKLKKQKEEKPEEKVSPKKIKTIETKIDENSEILDREKTVEKHHNVNDVKSSDNVKANCEISIKKSKGESPVNKNDEHTNHKDIVNSNMSLPEIVEALYRAEKGDNYHRRKSKRHESSSREHSVDKELTSRKWDLNNHRRKSKRQSSSRENSVDKELTSKKRNFSFNADRHAESPVKGKPDFLDFEPFPIMPSEMKPMLVTHLSSQRKDAKIVRVFKAKFVNHTATKPNISYSENPDVSKDAIYWVRNNLKMKNYNQPEVQNVIDVFLSNNAEVSEDRIKFLQTTETISNDFWNVKEIQNSLQRSFNSNNKKSDDNEFDLASERNKVEELHDFDKDKEFLKENVRKASDRKEGKDKEQNVCKENMKSEKPKLKKAKKSKSKREGTEEQEMNETPGAEGVVQEKETRKRSFWEDPENEQDEEVFKRKSKKEVSHESEAKVELKDEELCKRKSKKDTKQEMSKATFSNQIELEDRDFYNRLKKDKYETSEVKDEEKHVHKSKKVNKPEICNIERVEKEFFKGYKKGTAIEIPQTSVATKSQEELKYDKIFNLGKKDIMYQMPSSPTTQEINEKKFEDTYYRRKSEYNIPETSAWAQDELLKNKKKSKKDMKYQMPASPTTQTMEENENEETYYKRKTDCHTPETAARAQEELLRDKRKSKKNKYQMPASPRMQKMEEKKDRETYRRKYEYHTSEAAAWAQEETMKDKRKSNKDAKYQRSASPTTQAMEEQHDEEKYYRRKSEYHIPETAARAQEELIKNKRKSKKDTKYQMSTSPMAQMVEEQKDEKSCTINSSWEMFETVAEARTIKSEEVYEMKSKKEKKYQSPEKFRLLDPLEEMKSEETYKRKSKYQIPETAARAQEELLKAKKKSKKDKKHQLSEISTATPEEMHREKFNLGHEVDSETEPKHKDRVKKKSKKDKRSKKSKSKKCNSDSDNYDAEVENISSKISKYITEVEEKDKGDKAFTPPPKISNYGETIDTEVKENFNASYELTDEKHSNENKVVAHAPELSSINENMVATSSPALSPIKKDKIFGVVMSPIVQNKQQPAIVPSPSPYYPGVLAAETTNKISSILPGVASNESNIVTIAQVSGMIPGVVANPVQKIRPGIVQTPTLPTTSIKSTATTNVMPVAAFSTTEPLPPGMETRTPIPKPSMPGMEMQRPTLHPLETPIQRPLLPALETTIQRPPLPGIIMTSSPIQPKKKSEEPQTLNDEYEAFMNTLSNSESKKKTSVNDLINSVKQGDSKTFETLAPEEKVAASKKESFKNDKVESEKISDVKSENVVINMSPVIPLSKKEIKKLLRNAELTKKEKKRLEKRIKMLKAEKKEKKKTKKEKEKVQKKQEKLDRKKLKKLKKELKEKNKEKELADGEKLISKYKPFDFYSNRIDVAGKKNLNTEYAPEPQPISKPEQNAKFNSDEEHEKSLATKGTEVALAPDCSLSSPYSPSSPQYSDVDESIQNYNLNDIPFPDELSMIPIPDIPNNPIDKLLPISPSERNEFHHRSDMYNSKASPVTLKFGLKPSTNIRKKLADFERDDEEDLVNNEGLRHKKKLSTLDGSELNVSKNYAGSEEVLTTVNNEAKNNEELYKKSSDSKGEEERRFKSDRRDSRRDSYSPRRCEDRYDFKKRRDSRSPKRRSRSPRRKPVSRSPIRRDSRSPGIRRKRLRSSRSPDYRRRKDSRSPRRRHYSPRYRPRSPSPRGRRYSEGESKRSPSPKSSRKKTPSPDAKKQPKLSSEEEKPISSNEKCTTLDMNQSKPIDSISNHFQNTQVNQNWDYGHSDPYHSQLSSQLLSQNETSVQSPKRMSLDDRLKHEHGLEIEKEVETNNFYWNQNDTQGEFGNSVRVSNMIQIVPQDDAELAAKKPGPAPPPEVLKDKKGSLYSPPPIQRSKEKYEDSKSNDDLKLPKIDVELLKQQIKERKERKRKQKELKLKAKKERAMQKELMLEGKLLKEKDEQDKENNKDSETNDNDSTQNKENESKIVTENEKDEKEKSPFRIPSPPAKGILLLPAGIIPSERRKSVTFADGITPGDGSSSSEDEPEEKLPSPTPPEEIENEEKRVKKKNRMKVKKILKYTPQEVSENQTNLLDSPPPPPPESEVNPETVIQLFPGCDSCTIKSPGVFLLYAQPQFQPSVAQPITVNSGAQVQQINAVNSIDVVVNKDSPILLATNMGMMNST